MDFAIIAAPLFKLTRQDSEYQSGPLTEAALTAFQTLQGQLSKQPALAFPRHDWNYLLITNAYLPNKDSTGGLCANLAQRNNQGKIQIISHASRQLKENKKNYTRFLLETAAAAWGMDIFNEYLKGSKFILYRDITTETTLGTTQLKTLNRLKNTKIHHDFEVQDRQKSDLPDFLKKRQTWEGQEDSEQNRAFNKVIHVDLINADLHLNEASGQTILSITDDTRTFTQVAVLANNKIDSKAAAIWHHWCQPYGPPETILFNQGKVWASKLESRINNFMPLEQKINCRSRKDTFNQEVQQQWQQNRHDTTAEEFAQTWNFLWTFQGPDPTQTGYPDHGCLTDVHQNLTDDEDITGVENDDEKEELGKTSLNKPKRKRISLCRHKLQGGAYPQFRKMKTTPEEPDRLPEWEEAESDHEWLQLIQMEKMIEKHKHDLLKTRAQDHWDMDDDRKALWEAEGGPVKEKDDSLDDGDLAYINAILNSFSKPTFNRENSNNPELQLFTPEGTLTRGAAPIRLPPKFNQKFNQNLTSYSSEDENFSYFSNFEETGPTDLADYFSDEEEDDSVDNEDLSSESDRWSQPDFNEFEDFSNKEHPPSEFDTAIFGLETINETNFEDQGETNHLNNISSLSVETKLAFSAWQPFIPQEHAFQNFAAQSWPADFSQQASSSQEPTLIQISMIRGPIATTKPTKAPRRPITP